MLFYLLFGITGADPGPDAGVTAMATHEPNVAGRFITPVTIEIGGEETLRVAQGRLRPGSAILMLGSIRPRIRCVKVMGNLLAVGLPKRRTCYRLIFSERDNSREVKR